MRQNACELCSILQTSLPFSKVLSSCTDSWQLLLQMQGGMRIDHAEGRRATVQTAPLFRFGCSIRSEARSHTVPYSHMQHKMRSEWPDLGDFGGPGMPICSCAPLLARHLLSAPAKDDDWQTVRDMQRSYSPVQQHSMHGLRARIGEVHMSS
jgi:hypothetical protein